MTLQVSDFSSSVDDTALPPGVSVFVVPSIPHTQMPASEQEGKCPLLARPA